MDPFQCAVWLLAGELAALLGEAARWDWSDDQQNAARLSRELADSAYADRDLAAQHELFEDLRNAIDFAETEWKISGVLERRKIPALDDQNHGLNRVIGWREEARGLFERLHRLVFPGSDPTAPKPPTLLN